tara:strand:- start:159 stop:602 length:444 start_codon:yes stop_codon:yes gene_type:complete
LINNRKPPNPESVQYLKKYQPKAMIRSSALKGFPGITDGTYLYVVLEKNPGVIRYVDKKLEKQQGVKHPSLPQAISGKTGGVLIAGEFVIKGKKLKINNNSGHYSPDIKCMKYLKWLMGNYFKLKFIKETTRKLKDRNSNHLFYELS